MTPTPQGAVISHVTEVIATDNMGRPQNQVRVEYMVGKHGPFYETFPKTEFTAQNVTQKLDAFAQQVNQLSR
jgi:hypothetical protein